MESNGTSSKTINTKYTFRIELTKIAPLFYDFILFSEYASNYGKVLELTKGTNTYTVGNEFILLIHGKLKVNVKCTEFIMTNFFVKCSYSLSDSSLGVFIRYTTSLYADTLSKSTFYNNDMTFINPEHPIVHQFINSYLTKRWDAIKAREECCNKQSYTKEHVESGIIKTNKDLLWDVLTDWNKLKAIAPSVSQMKL